MLPLLALGLLLAALAAIGIAALGGGDDEGGRTAGNDPAPAAENKPATENKPKKKPAAQATATATPEAQATEEPAAEEPAANVPTGDNPQQLDAQGYALLQRGQAEQAIPYFEKAVSLCGSSSEAHCGYALYNMGTALNRAGRPAEAIPFLQQRLDRFPADRPGIVRKELKSACRTAGQSCQ